ncbi:hypothetical protein [Streptomyces sp. NPDC058486]|uniref:hypothetical protein n=1 Tax=unclassified Streptomyces TaxID=2593676 RepID=UPI003659C3D6
MSSLVRAEGRIGYSTLLWLVPVAVQITLDPLLVFGFDMGVRGAALGTVGGQAVSAAMSLWFFFGLRQRPHRIGTQDLLPHGPTLRAARHRPAVISGRNGRHPADRPGQRHPRGDRVGHRSRLQTFGMMPPTPASARGCSPSSTTTTAAV